MAHSHFNQTSFIPIIIFLLIACNAPGKSNDKTTETKTEEGKKVKDSVQSNTIKTDTVIHEPIKTNVPNELGFLADLNGQYPYDVKLLDNPILKRRLTKMLGAKYKFLKSIWNVETPIEINNNLFYAWAMQTHSGGDPGAVIMADLSKNVLYVGIRENARVKIYSEDGSEAPKKLQDWSKED
ncbi:MAG: hypothetical protein ACHQF0_02960 [Chitinophagales bacterium]